MKRILLPLLLTGVIAGMALLSACSDSTTAPATAADGRLVLHLTDAPGDYDEVNLTVIGVRIHKADADGENDGADEGGWMTVSDDTFSVDLLTLSGGNSVVLADTLLPAGEYTQVRLLLGEGCHLMVDGERHDLEVPSGEQSGLKLNHTFTLGGGAIYEVALDFDAHRSIVVTGNGGYKLKPVIEIIVVAVSGGLRGVAAPADARAMAWAVMDGDSSLAWADTLSGAFTFPLLHQGTYDVSLVPTAGDYGDTTITGVVVTAGDTTDMGTVEMPAGKPRD